MKKALSCKLILLLIAFALSLALAFSFYGAQSVHAADVTADNVSAYFSGAESFNLDGGNLKATVKGDKNSVNITNKLVVDDLAIEFNVPDAVSSIKVTLNYDSYFVNGAEKDGDFRKLIENEFTFDVNGNLTVYVSTEDNVVTVKVAGETQTKNDIYYKIKGADKCVAKVGFDFTLAENAESADIIIKSIDQKASDNSGAYKQTFNLEEDKIAAFALPRVAINNLPMKGNGDSLKAIVGTKYSFSFTAYSVFANVSASNLYIESKNDNVWADPSTTTPKSIIFEQGNGEYEFTVRTDETEFIERYVVETVYRDSDYNTAPEYIDFEENETVYEWYKTLVENAAKKEYTVDDKTITRSIRLGDSYEIPTLEDLVFDDYDLYSSLTYTVYYKTPSNAGGQTSSMKFTVSEAGDYEFYVVFKDLAGETMEKDDFYTEGDDGIPTYGKYGSAVFTFTVEDDAPISVEAPETQGKGYLNTTYVATEFKILSGNNETFTLYYNSDKNATATDSGWIELPKLADIKEDYNQDGFTYSDIKTLAYDGKYTFTPVKVGAYMIKCYVSSYNAVRSAEAETVVSISEKPSEVKVPSTWLKDNVWSVVFLSIGTLALIGVIVLLFIKPKEETETDETGDALKEKAQK